MKKVCAVLILLLSSSSLYATTYYCPKSVTVWGDGTIVGTPEFVPYQKYENYLHNSPYQFTGASYGNYKTQNGVECRYLLSTNGGFFNLNMAAPNYQWDKSGVTNWNGNNCSSHDPTTCPFVSLS